MKQHQHKHQHPFYRTYIDIVQNISYLFFQQCRKDILTQNQHMNKKIKSQISPFMTKLNKKLKQNKLRLAYFIGFICFFKLQPVYDCTYSQYYKIDVFERNTMINWVYNNVINYYTDCTKPIQVSIKQLQRQSKLINKNQTNKKLSELFYDIDREYPLAGLGYDKEKEGFVVIAGGDINNNNNTNNNTQELSLSEFIKICTTRYNNNVDQIQTLLNNLLIYSNSNNNSSGNSYNRQSMYSSVV